MNGTKDTSVKEALLGNRVDALEAGVVSSWQATLMQTSTRFLKKSSAFCLSPRIGGSTAAGLLLVLATAGFSQPAGTQSAIQQLEAAKVREANQAAQTSSGKSKVEGDTVPELYSGESEDLGSQMLLKEKPVIRYFEANADAQYGYTSNAFQDHSHAKDTGVLATTLSLAFAPEAFEFGSGKLSLRSGYRHLFWVYDLKNRNSATDANYLNGNNFELSTFYVNGRYEFAEKWNASFGVDHNRIMGGPTGSTWNHGRLFEPGSWKEIYTEFNPNWSLERAFSLNKSVTGSLTYSGGYHFTSVDPLPSSSRKANDHWDNNLMLSLMYSPVDKWLVQPYVRVAHGIYTHGGTVDGSSHRTDFTRSLGVNVIWSKSERTSVRLAFSGEARNSNDPNVTDYSKFDANAGLSFTFRF